MRRPDWSMELDVPQWVADLPDFPHVIAVSAIGLGLLCWLCARQLAYWAWLGWMAIQHAMGVHRYAWWHNTKTRSVWRCRYRNCGRLQFRNHKFYGE